MAETGTYIKLYRDIIDWEWFKDGNTLKVFIWLMVKANIKKNGFNGVSINRGQVATSYLTIARDTGLTVSQVRTAIRHLKMTGEVTGKIYPKFQVLTIVKYALYQDSVTGNRTGKSQASDKQVTGKPQQYKNIRMEERKNIPPAAAEDARDWERDIPDWFKGRFANEAAYRNYMEGGE